MLGSMDTNYCVLVGLAVFLEKWLSSGEGRTSQWLFGEGDTDCHDPIEEQEAEAERTKANYARAVKAAVMSEMFVPATTSEAEGKVGTHSV